MSVLDDHDQTRMALASLFAALAQTLDEGDKAFVRRYSENLEKISSELSNGPFDDPGVLNTIGWTCEMLKRP